MCESYLELHLGQELVLTAGGLFRLANPRAIVPGKTHLVRYEPLGQFATIVAICIVPSAP